MSETGKEGASRKDNLSKEDGSTLGGLSSRHGEIDLEKLADKVYELLKAELRIERERSGDSAPWTQ